MGNETIGKVAERPVVGEPSKTAETAPAKSRSLTSGHPVSGRTAGAANAGLTVSTPARMHADLREFHRAHPPADLSAEDAAKMMTGRDGKLDRAKMAVAIVKLTPRSFFSGANLQSWAQTADFDELFRLVGYKLDLDTFEAAALQAPSESQMNDINIANLAFPSIFGPFLDPEGSHPLFLAGKPEGSGTNACTACNRRI